MRFFDLFHLYLSELRDGQYAIVSRMRFVSFDACGSECKRIRLKLTPHSTNVFSFKIACCVKSRSTLFEIQFFVDNVFF